MATSIIFIVFYKIANFPYIIANTEATHVRAIFIDFLLILDRSGYISEVVSSRSGTARRDLDITKPQYAEHIY